MITTKSGSVWGYLQQPKVVVLYIYLAISISYDI